MRCRQKDTLTKAVYKIDAQKRLLEFPSPCIKYMHDAKFGTDKAIQ